MSVKRLRMKLIQFVPIRRLRRYLEFKYGWFPGNYVQRDVIISSIKNLKLEDNIYIGGNGAKLCCEGGIEIGRNTKIGEGCFFITTNHNYKSETHLPFDNIGIKQPIKIGRNCWIGARSKICPGVCVEDGAIIALGSVVTKSVPKCAIVGGNPAKIIGWRDKEKYEIIAKENAAYREEPIEWVEGEGFKGYLE